MIITIFSKKRIKPQKSLSIINIIYLEEEKILI